MPLWHTTKIWTPVKVVQNPGVLYIFTSKCASRYSGVHFFHIGTSKSGPYPSVFWHFDLQMCFSLQRRAIFPHRNFKKWSAHEVFCTFWLENVLLATAACNFSTSQLQKVVRECCVLYILTCKCASRYSGVQFFHIATSKSGPRPSVFLRFWLANVLLATAACNFSFPSWKATSAPAALTRLLFDPADPQIIEKHSISRLL